MLKSTMLSGGRKLLGLLGAFWVTVAVFVAVAGGVYVQRDGVATWLASIDGLQTSSDAAQLPVRFWLGIALRLGVFAAAVPLAAEGWIFVCRLRSAPTKIRLWPAFCLATLVGLAGAVALTRHLAGELRLSLIDLSDTRAPISRPDHSVPGG